MLARALACVVIACIADLAVVLPLELHRPGEIWGVWLALMIPGRIVLFVRTYRCPALGFKNWWLATLATLLFLPFGLGMAVVAAPGNLAATFLAALTHDPTRPRRARRAWSSMVALSTWLFFSVCWMAYTAKAGEWQMWCGPTVEWSPRPCRALRQRERGARVGFRRIQSWMDAEHLAHGRYPAEVSSTLLEGNLYRWACRSDGADYTCLAWADLDSDGDPGAFVFGTHTGCATCAPALAPPNAIALGLCADPHSLTQGEIADCKPNVF